MSYSAMQVANAFIDIAQKNPTILPDLTPMKLQKLMFFAQSWYLKNNNNLLFEEAFARWQYGPVIPDIYSVFKKFGAMPITEKAHDIWDDTDIPDIDSHDTEVHKFLNKICEVYGKYTGPQLSAMTHNPGTAWSLNSDKLYIEPDDLRQGRL